MVYLKSAWRKSWFSVIAFAFAFILLIGRAADAQIYTVGPHGTYCNIQGADNGGTGLYRFLASGTASLYNTIIYNNTTNTNSLTGLDTGNNLIGVDPMFVNSAGRDYRLLHGSPVINAGTNSPPGGLGSETFA